MDIVREDVQVVEKRCRRQREMEENDSLKLGKAERGRCRYGSIKLNTKCTLIVCSLELSR